MRAPHASGVEAPLRRDAGLRPRRRRGRPRAVIWCGGACPRKEVRGRAFVDSGRSRARVPNDPLLRDALVQTPSMQQRSAARSLRCYGLEVPRGFAMGSFARAAERVSQAVRTVIDRQRCGAAEPRPRRAKPRRRRERCHSTALLAAGNSAGAGRGSSCALFRVGTCDGHRGSCSSFCRRSALYDAPRVIFQARLKGSKAIVLPRRAPKSDAN